jgi:CDP-glycerol glycerophosphotransferase (TagB/SpsB family)
MMISDFSGIIFDYIFLFDKPVIYANASFNMEMYDAGDLDHLPWKFEAIKDIGMELKEEGLSNIKKIIEEASADSALRTSRKRVKETAWQHIGESGKLAADFLISLRDRIGA